MWRLPANSMIEAAMEYALFGYSVIPLVPRAKTPLTPHGLLEASRAEDVLRSWWTRWPDAGIGIVCGSISGVVVLDVDSGKGGDESLVELRRRIGSLPETPEVITQGGGRHLYFRHPGHDVRPSAGVLGQGLDLRGDGSYVVAPPSVGSSGRAYAWDIDSQDLPLAALPAALAGAVGSGPRGASIQRAGPLPERIPHGQRESLLTSLAGSMRRRGATPRAIEAALAVENLRCDPPLSMSAIQRIAHSVGRYVPQRTARGGFAL